LPMAGAMRAGAMRVAVFVAVAVVFFMTNKRLSGFVVKVEKNVTQSFGWLFGFYL
jgi:hypothetical protein